MSSTDEPPSPQPLKVIVDENAGPGSAIWQEFARLMNGKSAEYVFLGQSHPGIPDVEILDKVLRPGMVLLTGDRVLHTRAVQRGIRSFTLNEQGQLTRRALADLKLPPLPKSVHKELQETYHYRPVNDIPSRLKVSLREKEFRHYRTVRRRIRSHFGSAAAIGQLSITIGSQPTSRGVLCGFVFNVAGNSGVAGLCASEGYCLPTDGLQDPAYPVIHALRDQYLLQFDQVHTQLFVTAPRSLELCRSLLETDPSETGPPAALRSLLTGVQRISVQPSAKGPFFDSMIRKLDQLARKRSNEVVMIDFAELVSNLCGPPPPPYVPPDDEV